MAADDRMNLDFILQFLDVLERHGYHYHDDQHTGRAVGLLGDLARIYEGTQETPAATYHAEVPPSPQPETRPPGPQADQDAVILSATETGIIAAALDEAADYKRDRAADLRRLRGPVLRHLPVAPPRRRDLRPPGHPDALGRRGLPGRRRQAAHPRQRVPNPQPAPDGSRQGGRPVTTPRKTPAGPRTRQAATPPIPAQRPGDKDLAEMQDPYDLPFPDSTAGHKAVPRTRSWSTSSAAGSPAATVPGRSPGNRPPTREPASRPGSRTMTPTRK